MSTPDTAIVTDAGSLEVLTVGQVGGKFYVPAYQRGYRWTPQEVRQLLDDIRDSDGATYYLQPVVVKRRGDDAWELVDGQQRLTTLYLIFRYLRREHLPKLANRYSITYETRPGSKAYLDQLEEDQARNNIDFFHMFRAYECIERWFEAFEDAVTREATRLHDALFDRVKVLWYEAPEKVDSTELFTRLNVGRIPLTDAELVKALLLSHGQVRAGQADHALEMAAHWDLIERELRAPEVWAFVSGQAKEEATHISLLLDTLAGEPKSGERPLFFTFEHLRPQIQEDPQGFWREVVDLHSRILGWYDDRTLFHKVGYLVAIGKTFQQLVELSNGKGRSAFEEALNEEIQGHLRLTAGAVSDLTYTTGNTSDVLLLVNVETIRRMHDSSERYSFRAHAAGDWSLEHIHAQSAEPLTTVEQWRSWLEYHRAVLADLPGLEDDQRSDLIGRIDAVLAGEVTRQSFGLLQEQVTAALSSDEEPDDGVDSIANLALLAQGDNAAFSNSVFEVKRRAMIERDKAGSYIPASTRNVFLKYYTETADQQLHFWGMADRQSYLAAIHEMVGPYLLAEETP